MTAGASGGESLTPQESQAMSSPAPDVSASEYADMVAMVEAQIAGGEAPAPTNGAPPPAPAAAPAKTASGEAPKADGEAPTETPAEEIPSLTAAIRAREQSRKILDESRTEAQQAKEQMLAEGRAEIDRMRREMQADIERQRSEWRTKLHKNPLQAIQDEGLPVDELVADVAREGSPEWKLLKAEQARRAQLETKLSEFEKWKASQEERFKQETEQRKQFDRQQKTQEWVSLATADRAPNLRRIAEETFKLLSPVMPHIKTPDDVLVAIGDVQYHVATETTGKPVANLADLIQHAEYLARGQAASPPANGQSAGNSAQPQRATGSRTLNASAASERRASPKRSWEMSEDELKLASIAAVEEQMRAKR